MELADLFSLMQKYMLDEENARKMKQRQYHQDMKGQRWQDDQRMYIPKEDRYTLEDENLWKTCGFNRQACAFTNPGSELSMPWGTRLVKPGAEKWVVDHEDKHLDGWAHPGGLHGFSR